MPNKIEELQNDLIKRAEREQQVYSENFSRDVELTDEEKMKLDELEKELQTVVTEVNPDGTRVSTPISEYAAPLDSRVSEITDIIEGSKVAIKTVNSGDIKQSIDDIKNDAKNNAIRAFRELSVADTVVDDDDIMDINDRALLALKTYLNVDKLDSDYIVKRLHKLSLTELTHILPEEFVSIYVKPNEIKVNSYKAKERLLTCLAYMVTTGPELDYLNEYIDNEHRLMAVSQHLMKCQIEFIDMMKDPKCISEIVSEANAIEAPDDTIWSKYIKDPKRVHNEFAQKAVIFTKYKEAYEKIMDEYVGDEQSQELIQEQIDECIMKRDVYRNVLNLDLMKELWEILTSRLANNSRNTYKNLVREAVAALDRIRRNPQNVPFPVYDEKLAKRTDKLFELYLKEYSQMVIKYNKIVFGVKTKEPEKANENGIEMIHIDGKFDDTVIRYFSILLLILYGRIIKRLTSNDKTKYDAIMLDAYFQCLCKMGADIYLMSDIWKMMKDFVEYSIDTWPMTNKTK